MCGSFYMRMIFHSGCAGARLADKPADDDHVAGVAGHSFAWRKFRGGFALEWIGCYLHYANLSPGISEARTRWSVKWLEDTLARGGHWRHRYGRSHREIRLRFECSHPPQAVIGPTLCLDCCSPPTAYLPLPVMVKLVSRCSQKASERELPPGPFQLAKRIQGRFSMPMPCHRW